MSLTDLIGSEFALRSLEFVRVTPESLRYYEDAGYQLVGASGYNDGQVSLLLMREMPNGGAPVAGSEVRHHAE